MAKPKRSRPLRDKRIGNVCINLVDQEAGPLPLQIKLSTNDLVYCIAKEDHNWALIRKGSQVGIAPWKSLRLHRAGLLPFEHEIELPEFRGVYGKCGPCGTIFENVVTYTRHVKLYPHLECSKASRCTKCQSVFTRGSYKARHKCNTERLNRNCPLCGKQYTSRQNMRKHHAQHRKVPKCIKCRNECQTCREMQIRDVNSDESEDDEDQESTNDEDVENDGEPTAAAAPHTNEDDGDAGGLDDNEPAAAVSNWNSCKAIDRIDTLNHQLVDATLDLMNNIINKTTPPNQFYIIRNISLRKDLVSILDQTYFKTLRNLFNAYGRETRKVILSILEFYVVECNVREKLQDWLCVLTRLKNDIKIGSADNRHIATRILNALQQEQVMQEEPSIMYPKNINPEIDSICRTLIDNFLLCFVSQRPFAVSKLNEINSAIKVHTNSTSKDLFEESLLRHGLLHVAELIFCYRR